MDEKFVFDSLQDKDSIGAFLKALMDGMHEGKVRLSSNGDDIVLRPCGLMQFTVKARRKGDSSKISVKITWKDSRVESVPEEKTLTVSH